MNTRHAVLISIISFPLIFGARPAAAAHSSHRSTSRPVATEAPEAAPRLLELVNRDRAAAGLVGLSIARDATEIAGEWTDRMAAAGEISHNQAYLSEESMRRLNASLVGENVAMAQTADQIHDMLMQSPPHRANILKPDFREIGFGATRVDGDLYVTEAFLTRQSESPRRSASGSNTPRPAPPADAAPARSPAKPRATSPAPAKPARPRPTKATAPAKAPRPAPAQATAPAKPLRPAPAPAVASPPPTPDVPAEPAPPAEPAATAPAAVSAPDPGPSTAENDDTNLPLGYAHHAGGEPTTVDDDLAAPDEQPARPVDKSDMLTGAAAIGLLGTISRRRR